MLKSLRTSDASFAAVLAIAAFSLSCSSSSSSSSTSSSSTRTPAAAPNAALWGDMKSVVSVKELMRYTIDPIADNVFDAVSTVITRDKIVDTEPRTDEDWERVRIGAVTLAEGAYLLKIPRPFAPAGDENNSSGDEAFELSPAQIEAKRQADPVLWNAKIEALRNAGLEVIEIANRKDAKQLWAASDDLDAACENCHLEFWYPGQTALLERLDRHLEELYGHRTGHSAPMGMDRPKK